VVFVPLPGMHEPEFGAVGADFPVVGERVVEVHVGRQRHPIVRVVLLMISTPMLPLPVGELVLCFQVGVRESAQSWRELLIDVKRRGLKITPEIAVGDGVLGF